MATPIPVNQCKFSAAEIVSATGATYHGDPGIRIEGVSPDSRKIKLRQLFVALRGVHDGHDYIAEAAKLRPPRRSSNAAVRATSCPVSKLTTRSPRSASWPPAIRTHPPATRVTRHRRRRRRGQDHHQRAHRRPRARHFGQVLATIGNLNNLIGVPMTLLTLTPEDRAAVIECGTNQPGEIARLAAIVRPDVALVLNVDIEHTEGLGSLEGVADEEAALFATAKIAVTGAAEAMLLERVPQGTRLVTFGTSPSADVRLLGRTIIAPGRQRVSLALPHPMIEADLRLDTAVFGPEEEPEPLFDFALNLLGAASALNAAAAVAAVVAALGRALSRAQLTVIAAALETVKPVPGRLATREVHDHVVIDDTYNANPRSVRAALEAARETADGLKARLLVALGDMLELGALSAPMHAEALCELLRVKPDLIVLVGPEFAAAARTVAGLPDSGYDPNRIAFAADSATAAHAMRSLVKPGDVVLVKGSRGIAMEKVIHSLE